MRDLYDILLPGEPIEAGDEWVKISPDGTIAWTTVSNQQAASVPDFLRRTVIRRRVKTKVCDAILATLQRIRGNPVIAWEFDAKKGGALFEQLLAAAVELTGRPVEEMRERFTPE